MYNSLERFYFGCKVKEKRAKNKGNPFIFVLNGHFTLCFSPVRRKKSGSEYTKSAIFTL